VKFIDEDNFPNNIFIVPGTGLNLNLVEDKRIIHFKNKIKMFLVILYWIFFSKKIILHGLFYYNIAALFIPLFFLTNKIIWITWGGDVYLSYTNLKINLIRKIIIPKFGMIISNNKGDFLYLKNNYNLKNEVWYQSFVYPNMLTDNLSEKLSFPKESLRIMISHSSTPLNKHLDSIALIEKLDDFSDFSVYLPMAYGDFKYRDTIIDYVSNISTNNRYYIMKDYLELNQYIQFLSSIDVAIFMSDRQIGLNNMIPLLYYGCKVFISKESSSWDFFNDIGVKIFPIEEFNSSNLSAEFDSRLNSSIINKIFSSENLFNQWKYIQDFNRLVKN
jgi:hypothetical protein